MAVNLALKYAKKVDERFYRASQAQLALSNSYDFAGVQTVRIYSIPTVPLADYSRTASSNRYGTPSELQDTVQELTITKDRAFTFIIDKGNRTQQMMVKSAGQALAREIREVVVPEFDTYVFDKLARAAVGNSNTDAAAVSKTNAYEKFLKAQAALGDANVPDGGRVCFCSYEYANFLKQDPSFMLASERSKGQLDRGVIGTVDGVRIVRVPKSHLPAGAAFILTHPIAAVGPQQLKDYKTHNNPPGISGWLVEGRIIYDCFILNNKKDAIYYHGTAPASA